MITYGTTQNVEEYEGFRILKVQEQGLKTPFIFEGFGEDSHPLKNMTALIADTDADGEQVVIGYLDIEKITEIGEKRIFSLTPDGELSAYVWLKNNGDIVFNGEGNTLVRYNELKKKCDELQQFINTELVKIQSAITGLKGYYTASAVDFNISDANADKLKCE